MDQSVFVSPARCIHSDCAEVMCGVEMEKYGRTVLLVRGLHPPHGSVSARLRRAEGRWHHLL